MRLNFTKADIESIAPLAGKRLYVHDERQDGLCLTVTPTGSKTFYIRRRVNGRVKSVKVGRWPDLTIEQARKRAAQLLGDIAQGVDPQQARRGKGATLGEVYDHWLKHYAKKHLKSWTEESKRWDKHLKRWASLKLDEIDRLAVQTLHSRIGKKAPYQANRCLALLSRLFNYAESYFGWRGGLPTKGVKRFKEKKRDRFMLPEELPRFFTALKKEPQQIQDFLIVTLFTGQRRRNVESMRWEELHIDRSLWIIPDTKTKNGEPHIVPLAGPVMEVLVRRREQIAKDAEWVFPSQRGARCGHLVEPRGNWLLLCKRAGIEGLRIHDLRRTLASYQAMSGVSELIIGKGLGHLDSATTRIYARMNSEPVRLAMDTAATRILEVSVEGADNGK